ncbi:MAG: glutamate-1-semialdehyde 2,1-aminomutase [Acidobacteriota bacterium]
MSQSDATRSRQLMERARKVIPGGVNSPVRAFQAVGGHPPFIQSARGCLLQDADGRRYIDYLGSWGPMILGHAHPEVIEAIQEAASRGTSFGAPTELEVLLAEKILSFFPSIEKVRLVNSGTEATMSALRLARAFTGRTVIFKFDGCYHGHSDSLLVQAGSGLLTLGLAGSPGVPADFVRHTVSLPFNDLGRLEEAFEKYADRVAAVILEPVTGNMGVVQPAPGFLEGVLRLSDRHGAVAIFDEVMTGFRLAKGGAQELYALQAPLTCLGKIVGGGLPIGAYGGKAEIMERVAPQGDVYQAGTLSGNPIAVSAGLKTLEILDRDNPYARLEQLTGRLCRGLKEAADDSGVLLQVQSCGSMFTAFFNPQPVHDYDSAVGSSTRLFGEFFRELLERGVYLPPSQFEAGFIGASHSNEIIDETIEAARLALAKLPPA